MQAGDTVSVDWDGTPREVPKTVILTQVINHATEHRSQVMTILTQLGIAPPELDAWTHVVKPGMQGRRWNLALLSLGAGASIYANLAWSIGEHVGAWTWIDVMNAMVGAALLPVYAVVTAHAAPHVWTRCSASKRKAGRKAAASRDAVPVEPGRSAGRKSRKAEALAMIEAGEFDHIKTQAELARAMGVSESAVSRWSLRRSGGSWCAR